MKNVLLSLLVFSALSALSQNASAEFARRVAPENQTGAIKADDLPGTPRTAPFAPLFVVTCPVKFIVNFDPNSNNAFCQRAITYKTKLVCPSGYPTHVYFDADEVANLADRDYCLATGATLKPKSPSWLGKARIDGKYIDVPSNGFSGGQVFIGDHEPVFIGNEGWLLDPPTGADKAAARFHRTINFYAKPGYRANP
jgi:hypothetical protein